MHEFSEMAQILQVPEFRIDVRYEVNRSACRDWSNVKPLTAYSRFLLAQWFQEIREISFAECDIAFLTRSPDCAFALLRPH